MRRFAVISMVVCAIVALVAVAFAQQGQGQGQGQGRRRQPGQGQGQGQGQGGRGFQMAPSLNSTISGGKIYILKEDVLYKVNCSDLKVEKKKKLQLATEEDPTGRMVARMVGRATLTVEGKALFLLMYNAVYKVDLDSLEVQGSIKADDLTPPEEEKKEGEEGKGEGNGEDNF
jgi:hypothetical protein